MTERNQDQELFSLRAELDAMAAEVPEMPDSFRKSWREAVRRDAAQQREQISPLDAGETQSIVRAAGAAPDQAGTPDVVETQSIERSADSAPNRIIPQDTGETQSIVRAAGAAPDQAGTQDAGAAPELAQSERAAGQELPDFRELMRAAASGRKERRRSRAEKHGSAHWRRALSLAAAAAFILGGTLLGRESVIVIRNSAPGKSVTAAVQPSAAPPADRRESAVPAEPEPAALSGGDAAAPTGMPAPVSAAGSVPDPMHKTEVSLYSTEARQESVPAGEAALQSVPKSAFGAASDISASEANGIRAEKSAAVPETGEAEAADEAVYDALYEAEEAEEAAYDALYEAGAAEETEDAALEAEEADTAAPENSPTFVHPETGTENPEKVYAGSASGWLLGGILVGLAVFCWVFLMVTRTRVSRSREREKQ